MNDDIPTRILNTLSVAKPIALDIPRTFKHTSLILRRGNVVSIGTNHHRTHPLAKKYGYRFDEVHSELDALLRYRGPKNNLVLVNYRLNNDGALRMSKPCSLCLPWCAGIFDKIYYSTPKGMRLL
jgi:hypothetical protein